MRWEGKKVQEMGENFRKILWQFPFRIRPQTLLFISHRWKKYLSAINLESFCVFVMLTNEMPLWLVVSHRKWKISFWMMFKKHLRKHFDEFQWRFLMTNSISADASKPFNFFLLYDVIARKRSTVEASALEQWWRWDFERKNLAKLVLIQKKPSKEKTSNWDLNSLVPR